MPRSRILPFVLALGLAWLAFGHHGKGSGGVSGAGGTASGASAQARVVRVVDGDTILVDLGGRRERVRYIGVDTPESVKPDVPVQCFAHAASDANAKLVGGKTVQLEFDRERRDRFGRLLAYVIRAEDHLAVNEALVRNGFARAREFPPNTRHADRFAALQRAARVAGIGLWRACAAG